MNNATEAIRKRTQVIEIGMLASFAVAIGIASEHPYLAMSIGICIIVMLLKPKIEFLLKSK